MTQLDLFEPLRRPVQRVVADPEEVRKRLHRMLDEARRASEMPWDARTARRYQTIFPQMANWLPADEADALRVAFRDEIARLKGAEAS